VVAFLVTSATTWAGSAHAAGFALMEQNASGLGNAYAGQAAAAEDASTIFFNPAGMTRLQGRQVVVGGNFIRPKTEFNDNGSTPPFLEPPAPPLPLGHAPGGDGGDAGDLSFVPHGYLSWELVPSKVWVGVGVGVPFGLKTDYDDDWVGRFHGTKSEVKTLNINPSIAWKANETVSLGFGLNLQKFDAELANAVSYTAAILGGGGPYVPGLEGLATVEGDDWGWGWNAGVMLDLTPDTRVGISYRSKIKFELDGDVKFANRPAALAAALPNGDIEADVKVPDTLSIGVAHQLTPKTQLLADYTWTGWDSIQDISIYRDTGAGLSRLELNMHDSWRMGVGLNYQLNDAWKLRAGIAYDRSAIRDGRTPRLPDEDRLWFTLGAQLALSKQAAIDVGYAFITTRGDASVNQPNFATPKAGFPNSPRGNLVGDYDANVHIVGIQARYSF
jgi:long-chain fatty acid transport protein